MIDWASICPVSYNTSGVWKRERPDIRINFKKKKKRKIQIKCLTENMSIINTKKVKLIVCKKNFSFSYDQNLLVLFNFKFFKRVWK